MATAKKAAAKKRAPAKKAPARKASAKKSSAKKSSAKRASSKRELIAPRGDKRLVRRSADGQFKESDDLGRSLAADVRRKAKRAAPSGQGDKGDRQS